MAVYQTPSARLCDLLRNAGIVLFLVFVLKSAFTPADPASSRQATIETKGLRDPYSDSFLTADEPKTIEFDDDDDDEVGIDTLLHDDDDDDIGTVVVDGDDDDQITATEDGGPSSNVVSLALIGERHSGTKWMSSHLAECFPSIRFTNNPYRWKHWFQDESIEKFPGERFVVVAQFRNPYTWTESMRSFPHHSPDHFHLDWPDFVSRTWTMARKGPDLQYDGWTSETSREKHAKYCSAGDFYPYQMIPCMASRTTVSTRGIEMQALYELRNDGSGEPYDNILDMRKAKIENFLGVADFDRVDDFFVVRYEEAKLNGTEALVQDLEKALGLKAKCKPVQGDPTWRERSIPKKMRDYLKDHVHWDMEAKIGYFPSDSFE